MRLTTSQPSCVECHEIWDPLGHTGPVNGTALPLFNLDTFLSANIVSIPDGCF